MSLKIAVLVGVLSSLPAVPPGEDDWIFVGAERGEQVALRLGTLPANKATPFTAVLASFPQWWPANHHRYTVWSAEFDCAARTRSVKWVTQYSSNRDPVTTAVGERPVGDDSPAIAAQLNAVCGDTEAARQGQTFNHLGLVAQALGR